MKCDPKTKCRRAKLHNKMIDNSAPFLDQLFWQYLCFAKHFRSHAILKMFREQYNQWHLPSQIPLVSYSPTFGLNSWNSCNYSIAMAKDPTMTSRPLFGLYHLENGGCMYLSKLGKNSGIWQMLVNKPTWQRNVYLWQRHWSSWCFVRLD